jgi:hypothetical protein
MFHHLARCALGIGEAREGLPATICQRRGAPRRTHTHLRWHTPHHPQTSTAKFNIREKRGHRSHPTRSNSVAGEGWGASCVCVSVRVEQHLHCASAMVSKQLSVRRFSLHDQAKIATNPSTEILWRRAGQNNNANPNNQPSPATS